MISYNQVYMKNITMLLMLFIPFNLYSAQAEKCERYQIFGYVKRDAKSILKLVINEKTQSEIQLAVATSSLSAFAGYLDNFISAEISANQFDGQAGVAFDPKNIKLAVPDPLILKKRSTFELIKKADCSI